MGELEGEDGPGEVGLAEMALEQVARDFALFANREIEMDEVAAERRSERERAAGVIHISFKQAFVSDDSEVQGCLLVPLPDAISLAAYLMLKSREETAELRGATELDDAMKDAMLEIANLVGGAMDNALRWFLPSGFVVRSAGCQGVRAERRPYLANEAEQEYIVARTKTRVHDFETSDWVLMVPYLFDVG